MKYFSVIVITCFVCLSTSVFGQDGNAVQKRILKKMEDSLGLNSLEVSRIDQVNKELAAKKSVVRQQYGSQADSLQYHIQRIEITRDSLYKLVLPVKKYQQYKQQKRELLNNN